MSSVGLAIAAYSTGGVDFGVYYAAARLYLRGGNPYDYSQLSWEIVSATDKLNNPFYYAPWFIWFTLPFSLLPYPFARLIWSIMNFVLWIWGLFNLGIVLDYPHKNWSRWGMFLLVTFVFAWSAWGFEQVGVLIFFLVTCVLLFSERGQWNGLGLSLPLLLFKPNITALFVACILLWLILHRKWLPVLIALGFLAGMVLVSILISPNWYLDLLQPDKLVGLSYTLDFSGGAQIARHNTTLSDFLAAYKVPEGAAMVVYAFVVLCSIISLYLVFGYSEKMLPVSAVAVLVNFAVIPYALFYDYSCLVLTFFYANLLMNDKPGWYWMRIIANTLVALSLFIGDTISYRYWIVIILSVFLALAFWSDKTGNQSIKGENL